MEPNNGGMALVCLHLILTTNLYYNMCYFKITANKGQPLLLNQFNYFVTLTSPRRIVQIKIPLVSETDFSLFTVPLWQIMSLRCGTQHRLAR